MSVSVHAGLAQLVEQLICNQQVAGSSPITSSILSPTSENGPSNITRGEVPKWPTGEDCKSSGSAFAGSNPALSTKQKQTPFRRLFCLWVTQDEKRGLRPAVRAERTGCSRKQSEGGQAERELDATESA